MQLVPWAADGAVRHERGLYGAALRVGGGAVEIGNAVEQTAAADEVVQFFSFFVLQFEAMRGAGAAQGRGQGGADHLDLGNAAFVKSTPTLALKAHCDGKHIVLDEPYNLPANASLMVTLLPPSLPGAGSEKAWLRALASSDAFVFLAEPAEDIYTATNSEPFRDAVWSRPRSVSV